MWKVVTTSIFFPRVGRCWGIAELSLFCSFSWYMYIYIFSFILSKIISGLFSNVTISGPFLLRWAYSANRSLSWPVSKSKILLLLLSHFSHVRLCATQWTAAHQAPLSLGFSREEHWSGLPFPSPMHESEKWKWSRSVVSDSDRPHGMQPTRLLCPWDFPGKRTGVGCHCLLFFF